MSIIIKLQGGLGNQMFQYALGRSLSIYKNTMLKADLSFFYNSGQDTPRSYALDIFNLKLEVALSSNLALTKANFVNKLSKHLLPYYKQPIFRERNAFFYDQNVWHCRQHCYLSGYWQTEKYFNSYAEIIRKDFTFKNSPNSYNFELQQKISAVNAVAIHVRHGDYLNQEITNKYHGVCAESYYQNAVQYLTSKISSPHFFIFSDDPDWCKTHLELPGPKTVVDINQNNPAEDLRLMSQCKHFIIANSSFSWWGAWLAANPNKIIIAPKRWLNQENVKLGDLFPPDWILM